MGVKRGLEENEGRIGSFYGLLYVEKKRTGGKKEYLKATHKSERKSQAIEHWIYTYPHGYGSVSISSLEHLDGYFGIPVRRVRMIRGASRTFIMVTRFEAQEIGEAGLVFLTVAEISVKIAKPKEPHRF